jgi:hypothetical protein
VKTRRQEESKAEKRWKSAFLTLPDAAFFDILRNYLGELKTPYNKHSLLENLRQFLLKKETRARIISLVDENDARLLTAVSILDSPTPGDLYRLFEGEAGCLDFHYRLLNLQDRLLVYSDKARSAEEIVLTPFLEEDIENLVFDPALLLSCETARPAKIPAPWPGDTLLLAFFSCVLEDGDILKTGGALKKKAETLLKEKIPPLFEEGGARLMLLAGALETLKMTRRKDRLEVDLEAWTEFAAFAPRFRLCLLAAAAIRDGFLEAWKEAQWLSAFLAYLQADTAYSATSLLRLARLVCADTQAPRRDLPWLEKLAAFDILVPYKENSFILHPLFPSDQPHPPENAPGEMPPLIVQPNFDISVPPGLPLGEGLVVAAAGRLLRCDVYSRYELSKNSFSRALSLGLDGKTVERRLAALCGGSLPQNVVFSLQAWEKEYASIALFEGVLIAAQEDRRHLLEHHREFQKFVAARPAPGMYLIARGDLAPCMRALRGAGIEILPRLRSAEDIPRPGNSPQAPPPALPGGGIVFPRTFQPPALPFPLLKKTPSGGGGKKRRPPPPPGMGQELSDALRQAKLPEDLAGEVRQRIKRKLIIFPHQIQPELACGERTEAKGLNYVGKTLVIEQALENQSDYLETLVRGANGSPSRMLLRPKALRRSGADLILDGTSLPEGKAVSIPVKKISLVRRIRSALSG